MTPKHWSRCQEIALTVWSNILPKKNTLIQTRIEDNSFPTRGEWWISPRPSITPLWDKCLWGNFMSNLGMDRSLFIPIIWVPWQEALYGVLIELQNSVVNKTCEIITKPANAEGSRSESRHAVFRTVQQQVYLCGLSCLTFEQPKFILRPLTLSFKSPLSNKTNSRSSGRYLPLQIGL